MNRHTGGALSPKTQKRVELVVLRDILLRAGRRVPLTMLRRWSSQERHEAEKWAHLERLHETNPLVRRSAEPDHVRRWGPVP